MSIQKPKCLVHKCKKQVIHKCQNDKEIRKKLLKALQLEDVPGMMKLKNIFLCSDHFIPDATERAADYPVPDAIGVPEPATFTFKLKSCMRTYSRPRTVIVQNDISTMLSEKPTPEDDPLGETIKTEPESSNDQINEAENITPQLNPTFEVFDKSDNTTLKTEVEWNDYVNENETSNIPNNDSDSMSSTHIQSTYSTKSIELTDDKDSIQIMGHYEPSQPQRVSATTDGTPSTKKPKKVASSEKSRKNICTEINQSKNKSIEVSQENNSLQNTLDKQINHNIEKTSMTVDIATQTYGTAPFCSSLYASSDKTIQYFTGFDSYNQLEQVFSTLQVNLDNTQLYNFATETIKLSNFEQFFITLMVLCKQKTFIELSMLYNISDKQIKDIFYICIDHMFTQWKRNCIDKVAAKYVMLTIHKRHCNAKVILDVTKSPQEKLGMQNICKSSLSQHIKKVLLGIGLDGLITYVSPFYDGTVTDDEIITNTEPLVLLKATLAKGSHKSISTKTLVRQLMNYNILVKSFPKDAKWLMDKVVFVCAMLVNFQLK